MFEMVKEIPVTFEPHWADKSMLWLTAASVIVTAVLGGMAWWNGRSASAIANGAKRIAEEASEREERYRNEERLQRKFEERTRAAAAVVRAFWLLEAAIVAQGEDYRSESKRAADSAREEALVELELLHPNENPVALAFWFYESTTRMSKLSDQSDVRRRYRAQSVRAVREWKNRIIAADKLPPPNRDMDSPAE